MEMELNLKPQTNQNESHELGSKSLENDTQERVKQQTNEVSPQNKRKHKTKLASSTSEIDLTTFLPVAPGWIKQCPPNENGLLKQKGTAALDQQRALLERNEQNVDRASPQRHFAFEGFGSCG